MSLHSAPIDIFLDGLSAVNVEELASAHIALLYLTVHV